MRICHKKPVLLIITLIIYITLAGCSRKSTSAQLETSDVQNLTPSASITDISSQKVISGSISPSPAEAITDIPIPSYSPQSEFKPVSEIVPAAGEGEDHSMAAQALTATPKPTRPPVVTQSPATGAKSLNNTTSPATTPSPAITPSAITEAPSDNQDPNTGLSSEKDFVSELAITSEVNQLVCVIGSGGSDCTVSFHIKGKDGKWTEQFSTDGNCGSKGITYHKKEGDGKTPAGLYHFTIAFGIKPDPGSKLPYRQVTDYDYWIDDASSPYYNTWINSKETPGHYTSEHLIDHAPQYNYALNINYNSDCNPGAGSAIFLHGFNGLGHTAGCIAISEKYVKTIIQEADSNTELLIVTDREDLENYK